MLNNFIYKFKTNKKIRLIFFIIIIGFFLYNSFQFLSNTSDYSNNNFNKVGSILSSRVKLETDSNNKEDKEDNEDSGESIPKQLRWIYD